MVVTHTTIFSTAMY